LTRFFRENHHFDHLQTDVIEAKFGKINKSDVFKSQSNQQSQYTQTKKFHVWSAGCSTGEEPYSLAMTLLEATNGGVGWDLSILASDVDTNVLNTAKQGIYKDSSSIPSHMLSRYTEKMTDESFKMKQNVQKIIQFQHINFLSDWPIRQTFDAIFCRNVVIYFDKETQTRIFNHMADLLTPNGWLYIGHSESLYKICDRFKLMGRTIYQKNG
jgi:chemotaxis protein methyltransferase CheR